MIVVAQLIFVACYRRLIWRMPLSDIAFIFYCQSNPAPLSPPQGSPAAAAHCFACIFSSRTGISLIFVAKRKFIVSARQLPSHILCCDGYSLRRSVVTVGYFGLCGM